MFAFHPYGIPAVGCASLGASSRKRDYLPLGLLFFAALQKFDSRSARHPLKGMLKRR